MKIFLCVIVNIENTGTSEAQVARSQVLDMVVAKVPESQVHGPVEDRQSDVT
jgi:hypothetical protein